MFLLSQPGMGLMWMSGVQETAASVEESPPRLRDEQLAGFHIVCHLRGVLHQQQALTVPLFEPPVERLVAAADDDEPDVGGGFILFLQNGDDPHQSTGTHAAADHQQVAQGGVQSQTAQAFLLVRGDFQSFGLPGCPAGKAAPWGSPSG